MAILHCFKPIRSEEFIWKSFKDSNDTWRKQKQIISKEEISKKVSDEIENRRSFLFDKPYINLIAEAFDMDDERAIKATKRMFQKFVENGCKEDFLLELEDDFRLLWSKQQDRS